MVHFVSEARFVLTVALCLSLRSSNHFQPLSEQSTTLCKTANSAFFRADLSTAEKLYDQGVQLSRESHDRRMEARFLFGKANCVAARLNYRDSIPLYLRAKSIAASANDTANGATISLALSSLHGKMGDTEAALRYGREAAALPVGLLDSSSRARVSINLAIGCSLDHHFERCTPLYIRAVDDAIDSGDLRNMAYCRRLLGTHLLRVGDLDQAERHLNEALRLQLAAKAGDIAFSYVALAQLHLARHDPRLAYVLADRALATAATAIQSPRQTVYHTRALARRDLGDLPGALSDFQQAIALSRDWRSAVVPTDSARTGVSVWLQDLFADCLNTGMQQYSATGRQSLALAMFQVAEENRAASFRQKLLSQTKLPPAYWETLARLRIAERAPAAAREQLLNRLRLQLNEIELQSGIVGDTPVPHPHSEKENISSEKTLSRFRRLLRPQEALLSFHIGDKQSFLWAFTSRSFEVHVLPGRAAIAGAVTRLRSSLQAGDSHPQAASELYLALLGSLSPAVLQSRSWILILDDVLFQTPFAALLDPSQPSRFLIESHALRVLPAMAMLGHVESAPRRGTLLAVGDPVFNTADPRWTGPRTQSSPRLPFFLSAAPVSLPESLARLAGTAQEIWSCARAWRETGSNAVVLDAERASRVDVLNALRRGPQVVHFATHVIQGDPSADSAFLALALDSSGRPDFLTPAELSNRRFAVDLVTLSACNSGQGRTYPGAGLFGLTRAWLLAGARSVVAAQWPIGDDSGDFFPPFYSSLVSNPTLDSRTVAEALQTAQIAMLRSRSPHSQPGYWASFFVIGKE